MLNDILSDFRRRLADRKLVLIDAYWIQRRRLHHDGAFPNLAALDLNPQFRQALDVMENTLLNVFISY